MEEGTAPVSFGTTGVGAIDLWRREVRDLGCLSANLVAALFVSLAIVAYIKHQL